MDQSQPFNHNLFPWVHMVQKEFLRSFPGDYDLKALQFFQKNVEEEVKNVRNRRRRNLLFETLVEFYSHFCWKIKWDEPSPHMKDACVQLLTNLTKVGVALSNGDLHSNFCNRIMAALKMFPGGDNLIYTALLLVTRLNKKFHAAYGFILKQVLFSSHLVIGKPEVYLKVIFLLRRLISMLKDRSERTKVRLLASSLKPPPNTLQWLSSCCPNALYGTKVKLLGKKLVSDKLPADSFKRLREVLLSDLSVKTSTSQKGEKLQDPGSFIIDAVPGSQNDSEFQFIDSASPQDHAMHEPHHAEVSNSPPKRHLKRKQTEEILDDPEERPVTKTNSVKKGKKPPKICANHSDSDFKASNRSALTENSSQMEFAANISYKSPISAISDSKKNAGPNKKFKKKGKKRMRLTNLVGDEILVKSDSLSSESEQKSVGFDTGILSNMESPMVHSSVVVRKSTRLLSSESQLDSGTHSVDQDISSIYPADRETKELDMSTLSKEESSLVHTPITKSKKLLATESKLDPVTDSSDQDSSVCHADNKRESRELDTDTSNEKSSMIHAPIKKSKKLLPTENMQDHSVDEVSSSVYPGDSKQENEELGTDTLSNEESSLIHMPIRKSKRLLATESTQDHSVDQDSSVYPADSKRETKELDASILSKEESSLVHTPIKKGKRLLAAESTQDHSVDQDSSSVCHTDNKKERKELDTDALSNEESSMIPAPIRKSKRLLPTENMQDYSVDQDSSSVCPGDCKQENEELGTDTLSNEESSLIHVPIRKSKRLLATESKLDPVTDSVDQDSSSVCHVDNKIENKELGTDALSNEESSMIHAPIKKSKKLLPTENMQDHSVDQDSSSVLPGDSKQESKELDIDILSNEESSLIRMPIRKSKRLLATESTQDHSVDQDSSIYPGDSKQETKELDAGILSKEESSLVLTPIKKGKRLLATESKLDPVTDSVDQDSSSICPGDSKQENEEICTDTLSNEESSLIRVPIRKSKRLLTTERTQDHSVDQDSSSTCPGDSKQENKELGTGTLSNEETSLIHVQIRKSKRLLATESKQDHSVDQDSSSTCPGDSKQENKELGTGTLSNEESSLIHVQIRKSKRLLATESKQDHSVDQDSSSIYPGDSEQETKELHTGILSKEESSLVLTPIKKGKRLLATESKLDPVTDSVDQDSSSVCHVDNKLEDKELGTDTLSNEESSMIHAPIRKSKRLLPTENMQDYSVDQDSSSVCPGDRKQENEELGTDTLSNEESSLIHVPIRKSKRLLTTERTQDHSVDQGISSICPGDSKQEDKELSTDTLSNDESLLIHVPNKKSKRLLGTEGTQDHSVDQDSSSVCPGDSKQESKKLGTDTLSNEESSMIHAPIRKSKRLLPTENMQDHSVEQDSSSVCHADNKKESKELDTDMSNEESSLIHAPIRKSKRLLPTENMQDHSVDEDSSSTCPGDSKQENKELGTDTLSNEESSMIPAPIRKSKRLLPTENMQDYSVDQDSGSVCPGDSEQENDELGTGTLSNEESSLIHVQIRKSKRLLATESKQDPSVDQNSSSVCPGDSKKESKELDTDTSNEKSSWIHAQIRKSKRLLTTESKQDHSVEQDSSSICHADSKKESKELGTDTLSNEESSVIHAPIRKSKRLLTSESKLNPMTDSVDQDVSSIFPVDSKQENKIRDSDTLSKKELSLVHAHEPIRKRSVTAESKLDPMANSVDRDKCLNLTVDKQVCYEMNSDTLPNRESSMVHSYMPVRKSKRLIAVEDKIHTKTDCTCHDESVRNLNDHKVNEENYSLEDALENETVSNCKRISNVGNALPDILLARSNEDLKENFQVLETDTGFKIISSSPEELAAFRKSSQNVILETSNGTKSNQMFSDFIGARECLSSGKASPESTIDCQSVPVVIISPAENVGICCECEPSAVDNHLLHPNCKGILGSHSIPLNEKRPSLDLEGKAISHLNVSKVGSESADSELPNLFKNSSPKHEDGPISSTAPGKCLSSLKNPDEAVSTDTFTENSRVSSLTSSDERVEMPLIPNDTLDINVEAYDILKERAIKYVMDKMLTTIESADPSKLSPKTAICNKNTCNTVAVSGMTFSPFIRKAKNYLSFSDVSEENEPEKTCASCKLEDRIKDESKEFLGYRDFEDDLCDNKSESVMSEIIKIDHASSDASSFDSNNDEDSVDGVSTLPANTEAANSECHDSAGASIKQLSAFCTESGVEVKGASALENKEPNDGVSVSSNLVFAEDPKRLEVSLTSPIAVVSVGKRCDDGHKTDSSEIANPNASGTDEVIVVDEYCCLTDEKMAGKCSKETEKDGSMQRTLNTELENGSLAPDAKVQSAVTVNAPSTRLQSKKALKPMSEESDSNPSVDSSTSDHDAKGKRVAANLKKSVSTRKAPSKSGTSSGYSLRRSTRSRARDNVQLGLDFTKLSLDSPTQKRKKVASEGELDCVANDKGKTVEESNTDPSRRATRSSTLIETSDSLKSKDQTSNSESHNLRRSKRTLILPGKLRL